MHAFASSLYTNNDHPGELFVPARPTARRPGRVRARFKSGASHACSSSDSRPHGATLTASPTSIVERNQGVEQLAVGGDSHAGD